MQGNVFEWVWERYGGFDRGMVRDPFENEVGFKFDFNRPIKGGSVQSSAEDSVIYNRANASPALKHPLIGFRLVRTVVE